MNCSEIVVKSYSGVLHSINYTASTFWSYWTSFVPVFSMMWFVRYLVAILSWIWIITGCKILGILMQMDQIRESRINVAVPLWSITNSFLCLILETASAVLLCDSLGLYDVAAEFERFYLYFVFWRMMSTFYLRSNWKLSQNRLMASCVKLRVRAPRGD